MVRRYVAGAAAGAALVVSLAACQGDGDGKADATNVSAAQAIDQASKKTGSVDSYKVELTVAGTGMAASKLHGDIQIRLRPSVAATGTLDQTTVRGMTVSGGERAILLGDNFYAKVPDQLTHLTGGKQWVRFSVSQAERGTGVNVDELLQQANPADQTKVFTGSKDVRRVGTQSINGVKTTHYRGTFTPKQAAAQLDGHARKTFQDMYEKAGVRNATFDLWVGSDNLPRKLVTKADAKKGTLSATMIFSDYNKSFSVSAPPSSEVHDGNGLADFTGH